MVVVVHVLVDCSVDGGLHYAHIGFLIAEEQLEVCGTAVVTKQFVDQLEHCRLAIRTCAVGDEQKLLIDRASDGIAQCPLDPPDEFPVTAEDVVDEPIEVRTIGSLNECC